MWGIIILFFLSSLLLTSGRYLKKLGFLNKMLTASNELGSELVLGFLKLKMVQVVTASNELLETS